MENGKSKYEEKLSAYLDGELSPKEMAEVAAELASNLKLADKLEKLRCIDELADETLQEFDEGLLDRLNQNIMVNLDSEITDSDTDSDIEEPRRKIMPIWQRYVAVAASIAIFFLVGKLAFEETKNKSLLAPEVRTDQLIRLQSPEEKFEDIATDTNRVMETESPDIEEEPMVGRTEGMTMDDVKPYETDKAVVTPDEFRKTAYDAAPVQSPIPPPTTPAENPKAEEKGDIYENVRVLEKESGPNPMAAEATSELQTEPSGYIQQSDEDVQTAKKQTAEKREMSLKDYEYMQKSNVAGSFEPKEIEIQKSIKKSKMAFKDESGASISDSLLIGLMPLDSLKNIFALYVPDVKARSKEYLKPQSFSTTETVDISQSGLQMLLDSLAQLPGIDNEAEEIENLYLKARTYYELYLTTNDIRDFHEAVLARDALNTILNTKMTEHPGDMQLIEYANDIKSWRFNK